VLSFLEMSKPKLMDACSPPRRASIRPAIHRGFVDANDWRTRIYPAGQPPERRAPVHRRHLRAQHQSRSAPRRAGFAATRATFRPTVDDGPRAAGIDLIDYSATGAWAWGNRNNDSREREIAEISRGLKSLAKDPAFP